MMVVHLPGRGSRILLSIFVLVTNQQPSNSSHCIQFPKCCSLIGVITNLKQKQPPFCLTLNMHRLDIV